MGKADGWNEAKQSRGLFQPARARNSLGERGLIDGSRFSV
jgi:hypothetical protein